MAAKKGSKPKVAAVTKKKKETTTSKKTTVTKQTTTKAKKVSHKFQQVTTPRWTDAFDAAAHNDTAAVKHFVERDENAVRMTDPEEKTIALIAAENLNFSLLKYVLGKNGSEVLLRSPDIFGNTVLQRAIEKNDLEMVKYLVEEHNWNVTESNSRSHENTPLHVAAEEGHLEILKYFVEERKADVNVRNELGNPPLFLAADRPHLNVVRYLVEQCKADVMALNSHGCNILFQSAKRGDVEVPKYLLDEKKTPLDVNWQDLMNCTIVYTAARYAKYEFIHYVVTEHHADLNIADEQKRTPLHVSAHQNNYAMSKFFIDHGASLELKNAYNKTPTEEATDPKVRGFLDDMTNVLRRERAERALRSRRSVPPVSGLKPPPPQSVGLSLNTLSEDRIQFPRVVSFGEDEKRPMASSAGLHNFLIVADTVLRYMWGTPRQLSHRAPLTRREELQYRMETAFAVDAVNASFAFEY